MAIIYSYPQAIPKDSDLIIGTVTYDPNDPAPVRGNPTRSFRVSDLAASITGNSYTLTSKALGANSSIVLTDNTGFIAGTVNFNSGSGVSALNSGNTITITNTGVLSNIAGTGISLSGTTGNVTITNSGVTGMAITDTTFVDLSLSSATGDVTLTAALSATGAPGNSNYLRGDNQWFTPVTTINTTDGTYINLTPNTAANGAVTVTADLSAIGTPTNLNFLRGDNTWAVPAGGGTVTSVNSGTGISVDNTDPDNPIINNTGVLSNIAGTGISINNATGNSTITNTAPDQTVVITGSGDTTVTGTYPTFDISSDSGVTQIVAGNDISISPVGGTGIVTINSTSQGGVTSLIAGNNITLSPVTGLGDVTVNAPGLIPYTETSTANIQFVSEDVALGGGSSSDTVVPSQLAVKTYVDNTVVGGLIYQGGYDASTNTPDLTASPNSILKGWTYAVTVAGDASGFWVPTLGVGDLVIANVDNPTSASDWTEVQSNIDVATDTVLGIANFPTAGGLSVTAGAVSLPVTGVTAGAYTNANITVDNKGRITAANNGLPGGVINLTTANSTYVNLLDSGTVAQPILTASLSAGSGIATEFLRGDNTWNTAVTSITAGTGLDGGTITTTGTIDLADTAVTPGAYTNANITVDQQGRITSATNNPGAGTVTSVGLAAPSAFTVTNSPVTTTGTLTLSGAGTNAQFIDGTGSLQSTSAFSPTLGVVTDGSNVDMRLETGGLLLSTVQFTAGSAMEITQSGGNDMTINLNNSGVTAGTYFAPSITVDAKGRITSATPTSAITGGGTAGRIPVFSATNSIGNSIMTETTGLITTAGSIKPTSITDTNNDIGTAGQILSSTGSAIDWVDNTGEGYDLNATTDGSNVDLNLTSTSGTDNSTVQFTAGSNMTITQAGGNNITLASEEINEIIVTVQNVGGNNKYFIDGAQQQSLELVSGFTYRLDQADSSNSTHPLRFSTNADNTPSAPYTTGVTVVGTPGSAGAYTQIILEQDTPKLYYYCSNHSGMGGEVIDPRATSADSFTATSGTFINFTPTTTQTGAVTLTGDLSATGTPDSTTFLRGDNQWVTVAGTTYDYSSAQSGDDVNLNLIPSTGATDTVTLVAGSNITLTDNGSNNVTIAASTSGGGTIEKNDFTGTGSQTQFILTTAPASILFTDVYINGVYQEKETYSVTGTSLDFTTAPPLNVSIEVMSIIVSNLLPGANTLTTDDFTGTGSQTDFILSTAPPNIDFTSVYVSGVYQQKGQAYTVSGTTLTFTGAPDLNDTIEVVIISSASLVNTAPANYNTSVISSSTNASKNTLYVLKANLTLTLPASPAAGDSIKISNLSGVATCIVARNGNNIMATAADLTLDNAVASFELVYTDATNGWVIIGPQ